MVRRFAYACLAAILVAMVPSLSRAETRELRVAIQDGLAYLPCIIMNHEKLVEKHAKATGVPELKVTWARFANSVIMNDGLLSGNLDMPPAACPASSCCGRRPRAT